MCGVLVLFVSRPPVSTASASRVLTASDADTSRAFAPSLYKCLFLDCESGDEGYIQPIPEYSLQHRFRNQERGISCVKAQIDDDG